MRWVVETLDPRVDREIADLPDGLRARILRLLELMEFKGPQGLTAPHARHLDGPLWELRAKAGEGIARGIYVAVSGTAGHHPAWSLSRKRKRHRVGHLPSRGRG